MLKLLSMLFLINTFTKSYANDLHPYLPDCVDGYNSFLNRYANETAVNISHTYTDISASECASRCNNMTSCLSFNFFPSNILSSNSSSKCELINSISNTENLLHKSYVGFYLKAPNDCSTEKMKDYILLGLGSALLLIAIGMCCYCGCKKKARNGYNNI